MIPIIIPVHNRPELTEQCLSSLTSNTPPGSYQLIVVDDASTDYKTIDYLKTFDPITLPERVNHGAACNRGAREVLDSEFIYFGDNDTYFAPGWLETLTKAATTFPEFGIVGGDRHPWHGATRVWERDGIQVEQSDMQVGYTMLMRRETWEACGPFQEDPVGVYGQDDVALGEAVKRTGKILGALTPRVVYHCGITKTDGSAAIGAEYFVTQGPEGVLKL